jgi:hypothetical protein
MLAPLAPVMVDMAKHALKESAWEIPWWTAPILIFAAQWIISHKALNTPRPDLISRKQLVSLVEMAHERDVDLDALARDISGDRDAHELTGREGNRVFDRLKKLPRIPFAPPLLPGNSDDDPDRTPVC